MRFDVGSASTDLIPFVVAGARRDGSAWEETFHALPEAPAAAFQHLLNSVHVDPGTGAVGYLAPDVIKFIKAVLVDDAERSRFERMLGDTARFVSATHLFKIMQWLTERQGAGFPTGGRTGSSAGASPNGSTSAGAPSLTGSPTQDPSRMGPAAVYGQEWTPAGGPGQGFSPTPG